MSEELSRSELIQVVQLPVIQERLRSMKEVVERQTSDALALVVNDDTLTQVRKVRADLTKTFTDLEEQRKAVKKAIIGPYDAFEAVYRECVADIFRKADAELKAKINAVEDGIKGECEAKMREYFAALCAAEHLDWIKFEWVGLKIDLASARQKSHSKLREQIADFVVGVAQDVNAISKMDYSEEIMDEYRRCLDMSKAVSIVQDRHQRIEEERKAAEARKAAIEAQKAAVEKVETAVQTHIVVPPLAAPMAAPAPQQEDEKVYKCSFTVRATKAQLKRLKEFMNQEGIQYE